MALKKRRKVQKVTTHWFLGGLFLLLHRYQLETGQCARLHRSVYLLFKMNVPPATCDDSRSPPCNTPEPSLSDTTGHSDAWPLGNRRDTGTFEDMHECVCAARSLLLVVKPCARSQHTLQHLADSVARHMNTVAVAS